MKKKHKNNRPSSQSQTSHTSKMTSLVNRFADSWAFVYIVAILAALDAYILIVPIEVLLLPAILAHKKKWARTAFSVSLGSAVGATSFAYLTSVYGLKFLHRFIPTLGESAKWSEALQAIHHYGAWGLGLISLSPFPQHLAVAAAGLAKLSVPVVFFSVLIGRTIKYVALSALIVFAPEKLSKFKKFRELSKSSDQKNSARKS